MTPTTTETPNSDDDSASTVSAVIAQAIATATAKKTQHRAPPLALPMDGTAAAALVCQQIREGAPYDRSQAIEGMALRLDSLQDMSRPAALDELKTHLPVLQAMWLRLTAEAFEASSAHKPALLRAALNGQAAYSRTVALLSGLELQRKGRGTVTVSDDDDLGDDL